MSKLHRSFKNIRVPVIDAALTLFESKPWSLSPDDQQKAANEFVRAASAAYSVASPEVIVDVLDPDGAYYNGAYSYHPAEAVEGGDGLPTSVQAAQIILRKWSIVTLFGCFRAHLLNSGVEARENTNEPYGWAFSLFYAVKPAMFRARVREGRISAAEFGEIDLYSRNTLARAVAAGVVTEEGEILVSNFPKYLNDLEAGTLTVDQLLASVNIEDEELAEEDDDDFEDDDDEVSETPEPQVVSPQGIDASDGLDDLGITELRQLSRGRISGGYSLRKPALVAALREAGVRASDR